MHAQQPNSHPSVYWYYFGIYWYWYIGIGYIGTYWYYILIDFIRSPEILKVLTKTSSPHDKRIKIVKPTPNFVNEFEAWSEEFYSDDNWEMKTDYKKL